MKNVFGILIFLSICSFVFSVESETDEVRPGEIVLQEICSVCRCNTGWKNIDCRSVNLSRLFSSEEWAAFDIDQYEMNMVLFDNNEIEAVTMFPKWPITSLFLPHNNISKIEPKAFRNLRNLQYLDLSFNRLTTETVGLESFDGKPDEYSDYSLDNLKWLKLSNNDIKSLDANAFARFPRLATLFLDHNPFGILDNNSTIAIANNPELNKLDLSYMELETLPEDLFQSMPSLQELNLNGNRFRTIPVALKYAVGLTQLTLSENPIEYFGTNGAMFPYLPNLERLIMHHMPKLRTIGDGSFHNLPVLKNFICFENPHLSEIHAHAFAAPDKDAPPIETLYLNGNNLSSIERHLIRHWDEISEIDIRDNPWNCDQWMIDTLIPLIKNDSINFILHSDDYFPDYDYCGTSKTVASLQDQPKTELLQWAEEDYNEYREPLTNFEKIQSKLSDPWCLAKIGILVFSVVLLLLVIREYLSRNCRRHNNFKKI